MPQHTMTNDRTQPISENNSHTIHITLNMDTTGAGLFKIATLSMTNDDLTSIIHTIQNSFLAEYIKKEKTFSTILYNTIDTINTMICQNGNSPIVCIADENCLVRTNEELDSMFNLTDRNNIDIDVEYVIPSEWHNQLHLIPHTENIYCVRDSMYLSVISLKEEGSFTKLQDILSTFAVVA